MAAAYGGAPPRSAPHRRNALVGRGRVDLFLQQQLGHADIQTTIDQYGHPDKQAHREAARGRRVGGARRSDGTIGEPFAGPQWWEVSRPFGVSRDQIATAAELDVEPGFK